MKKNVLLAATMAAVLASCSSDDLSLQSSNQEAPQDGKIMPAFDALTQRSISTRAGYAGGVMNDDQLKASKENDGGFGVFAYDTSAPMYESQSSDANFMWNQGVFYNGSSFEYTNVHYWPQHYGSDAQSDGIDQVSFFAYAPYVDASTNGKVAEIESGITGFTSNTAKGDPRVKYVASFEPSKSVDLCWGVCDEADKDWKIIQGNAVQEMTAGMPWIDVQRPAKAIGQKVKFTFKHALAQLNVQIDADPDIDEHNGESKIAEGTKVYVRSITFSGLAQKGALNLNNTEANIANWEVYNCCGETLQGESVTLYDGRKDKMEGVAGAVASSEKLQCLNPTIISDDNNTTEGVTHELKNLFNSTSEDAPVYVIPTGDDFTVTISYDIESANPNLPGYLSDKKTHGFSDSNTLTKQVKFGDLTKLENGKKYLLKIHLGLNSIKFDADVTDWDDTAEAGNVYLPSNVAKGVSLNKTATTIKAGESETLTATVTPSDAVDKTVTWRSSDETVATVDQSGNVTAVAEGTATIYADNNGSTTTCEVKVVIPLSMATSEHVAKYAGVDGFIYESKEDAESNGTTVGGWIAYSTDDHHGLILAMNSTATGKNWDDAMATDFSSMTSISGAGDWHLPTAHYHLKNLEWDKMIPGIEANVASCPLPYGNYWSSIQGEERIDFADYFQFDETYIRTQAMSKSELGVVWACCEF